LRPVATSLIALKYGFSTALESPFADNKAMKPMTIVERKPKRSWRFRG